MKKQRIKMVCCLLLVILTLSGCASKNFKMTSWEGHSETEGFNVSLNAEILTKEKTYLELNWENDSDKKINSGSRYTLYRKILGLWIKIPFRLGVGYNDELIGVLPGDATVVTYHIDSRTRPLKRGTYRLKHKYWYENNLDEKYCIYFDFEIGE